MSAASVLTFAADHLWQSTLFAGVAALVALALRRRSAQVRYWIWMAASLKFLVPFAALATIGGALSWRTVEVRPYENPVALIETVSQPFSQTDVTVRTATRQANSASVIPFVAAALVPIWAFGVLALLAVWLVRWRRVSLTLRQATQMHSGREVHLLRRLADVLGVDAPPMYATGTTLEPGVFGIVRPVLLWPRGMSAHLTDDQIAAILSHELCHLRRHDNLAALLHMATQAVFWFHPLTWWIGARLVDERERACDEAVIRLGSEREVYAESILKTCKFSLESPLVCVSGVTGSDLKKRIEQIMTHEDRQVLPFWRRALLAAAGVVALATPVVFGALNPAPQTREVAPAASLPAFEEASIRPNTTPGPAGRNSQVQATRWQTQNVTLKTILQMAFATPATATPNAANPLSASQVVGGPGWIAQEKFDIIAVTPAATQPTPPAQTRQMIQRLLAERFRLAAHWETREVPVYALVRVRPDGPLAAGLTPTSDEECARAKPATPGQPLAPGQLPACGNIQFGPGQLFARGAPMEWLASTLTTTPGVAGIDRPVIDRTGLKGNYGFALKFAPSGAANPDPDRPELFTALQEQLGLKLEPLRAPIDVLVVDAVEKPEPN